MIPKSIADRCQFRPVPIRNQHETISIRNSGQEEKVRNFVCFALLLGLISSPYAHPYQKKESKGIHYDEDGRLLEPFPNFDGEGSIEIVILLGPEYKLRQGDEIVTRDRQTEVQRRLYGLWKLYHSSDNQLARPARQIELATAKILSLLNDNHPDWKDVESTLKNNSPPFHIQNICDHQVLCSVIQSAKPQEVKYYLKYAYPESDDESVLTEFENSGPNQVVTLDLDPRFERLNYQIFRKNCDEEIPKKINELILEINNEAKVFNLRTLSEEYLTLEEAKQKLSDSLDSVEVEKLKAAYKSLKQLVNHEEQRAKKESDLLAAINEDNQFEIETLSAQLKKLTQKIHTEYSKIKGDLYKEKLLRKIQNGDPTNQHQTNLKNHFIDIQLMKREMEQILGMGLGEKVFDPTTELNRLQTELKQKQTTLANEEKALERWTEQLGNIGVEIGELRFGNSDKPSISLSDLSLGHYIQIRNDFQTKRKPQLLQRIKGLKGQISELKLITHPRKFLKESTYPYGENIKVLTYDAAHQFITENRQVEIDDDDRVFVLLENTGQPFKLKSSVTDFTPDLDIPDIVGVDPLVLLEFQTLTLEVAPAPLPAPSSDQQVFIPMVPPKRLQPKEETQPQLSYSLKIQNRNPGNSKVSFTFEPKNTEPTGEIPPVKGSYVIFKNLRLRLRAGMLYSKLQDQSVDADPDIVQTRTVQNDGVVTTRQIVIPGNESVTPQENLIPVFGFSWYWQRRTFSQMENLNWGQRLVPNPYFAISITDPRENFFLGGNIEPRAGISLNIGLHYGKVNSFTEKEEVYIDPVFPDFSATYITQEEDSEWHGKLAVGLSVDLNTFANLLKPIFTR